MPPVKTNSELHTAVSDSTHLLIVDDEPEIADSLADYLIKKTGFEVSITNDGQEAITFLEATVAEETEIDLVLLDMRMPTLSGLDVLNWIRDHPDLRYTRVVLLTAAAGSNEKVEALSAGADDYITKPYRPQELLARVNTILRTQQLEKQLQHQSQQLADLNRITQQVAVKLEQSDILEAAVAGVEELMGVELAAAMLKEGGKLRYKNLRNQEGPVPISAIPSIPADNGLTGFVFRERTAVYLNDISEDNRFLLNQDAPPNFEPLSAIYAPLVVRGRAVGLISGFNKKDGLFNDFDLDIYNSLARSLSEAIENAWLFQRIRQRQQELLENRNTLQALIDGIPNPIYTINDDWELVGINKNKADEHGETQEALVGQVCYQAFFERNAPCTHCQVAYTLSEKVAGHWTLNYKGEDHLPREWDINAYPIPTKQASSARAVMVWQDRTEERRLESSLLQAGKLAAIGQLAAGVAHEINNPLTAINANAEILLMTTPSDDENYESMDLILQAGERATKVVRGLLDFARQEQYAFTADTVNKSIQQALALVHYQLQTADTEVVENLAGDLPKVTASWEHLKSVWLNIIVNARDALHEQEGERRIEITTRIAKETTHIQVLFRDNGKGMSSAELAHIFEPFYTTKDPGMGTGLGLATSHRIIEQHGGEINVVSAPGEGTTFIIRLPVKNNNI